MKRWQSVFVVVIRTCSVLYCLLMGIVMMVAKTNPLMKAASAIQHETLALGVFAGIGLSHVYGLLALSCCRRQPRKPKRSTILPEEKPNSFIVNAIVNIEYSDAWILVAEMIEIPVQSIQCYLIHAQTISQTYALLSTVILLMNCWMSSCGTLKL